MDVSEFTLCVVTTCNMGQSDNLIMEMPLPLVSEKGEITVFLHLHALGHIPVVFAASPTCVFFLLMEFRTIR